MLHVQGSCCNTVFDCYAQHYCCKSKQFNNKLKSFVKRLQEDNLYNRLPKTNKTLMTSPNCSLLLQHGGKTLVRSFGRMSNLPSQPRT